MTALLEHRWAKARVSELRARWPERVPYVTVDPDQDGYALFFNGGLLGVDHSIRLRGVATDHLLASAYAVRACKLMVIEAHYAGPNTITAFRQAVRAGMILGACLEAMKQGESNLDLTVVWMSPSSWQSHLRKGVGSQPARANVKAMARTHAKNYLGGGEPPQGQADAFAMATTLEEQLGW